MINSNDITISKMTLVDVTTVASVEQEAFGELSQNINFACELENRTSYFIVAKLDAKIVGYAGLWNLYDHADIISLAVKNDCQRMGVASKLIINFINYCLDNSLDKIYLEVRISNIIAQGLYKKFGFDIINKRKNYYPDNSEDAIVMVKNLK